MMVYYRARRTQSSRLAKKVCKQMENEGPRSVEGRGPPDPTENVVHFPRDWFGPTEDLVPFGPRASQAGVVDLEPPAPVRPDDFWGEDSASIHDVLRAPGALEPAPIVVEIAAPSQPRFRPHFVSRARAAIGRLALAAPRLRLAVPSIRLPLPRVPQPTLPHFPRTTSVRFPRTRTVSLIAGGAAVLVFCAIALAKLGATPARSPQPVTARTDHAVAATRPAALAIDPTIWARVVNRGASAQARAHVVHRRSRSPRPGITSRVGTGTPAPTTASTSPPVTGLVTSVSTSSASSGGSAGAGGGSASAGPQGAGAPFGPGHLG
jgi:hypothetical protein